MKVIKFEEDFFKLSLLEKRDYLKKILDKNNLKVIINSLVNSDIDIEECFEIINSLSKTKIFKQQNNIANLELTSLIISSYIKNNKTKELENYLVNLDSNKLKKIINYEIDNKTEFSKLKLCNKLLNENNPKIEDNKTKKVLDDKKINNKKNKKIKVSIIFILFLIVLILLYGLVGYSYKKIKYYNTHVYPNIYLDNKLISDLSHDEIKKILNDKELVINANIILKNDNNEYTYLYKDIGYTTNKDQLLDKIINNYNKLNGYEKLYQIFFNNRLDYKFEYLLSDEIYNNFINDLKSKVNVLKTNEYFSIKNGNINYQKGLNGFTLDDSTLKDEISNTIISGNREIILKGNIETTNNSLGLINKKVSTFTTYYNESQGRARNIRNAVSKLNGRILYPNDTFSFYRAVGPYNGAHGYIFYGKDVGSGVCQVSTTIYNAALRLNLPIISRENHGDMVYYVDYGMDATVYGSSVDMKFKNNSKYPIYIEASAYNGNLTVSLWSNENIIPNGYSYSPRVERLGGLSFKTYLDTYRNGEFISTKYLNSSYYVKGK